MEDLYCQEQLQVDSLSPDQGYKTDYSAGMTNWPTVTKVRNTGLWLVKTGHLTWTLASHWSGTAHNSCCHWSGRGGPGPAGGPGVPQHDGHRGLLHLRQQLLRERAEGDKAPHEEARHRLDAWGRYREDWIIHLILLSSQVVVSETTINLICFCGPSCVWQL